MTLAWLAAVVLGFFVIGKGRDEVNREAVGSLPDGGFTRDEIFAILWPRLLATSILALISL